MPLDRHARRLLAMLAASDPGTGCEISIAQRRQGLDSLAEVAEDRDAQGATAHDVWIDDDLRGRLYSPLKAGAAPAPALLYFHGGGWVAGGLETHQGVCRRLAAASGCRVLAVDYRLAPEHPFPAALNDGHAALRWAAGAGLAFGIDPARLAVGGDSAGGGLASALALEAAAEVRLQVLICPILDPLRESESRIAFADGFFLDRARFQADLAAYCPAGAGADEVRLSPLRASAGILANAPPALIHAAEFDPFRDEALAYADAIQAAGGSAKAYVHAGMIHYFYALANAIPAARAAAQTIGEEIRSFFG